MADSPQSLPPTTELQSAGLADSTTTGNRMGAKGLFTADGDLLLIEESRDDGSSFWTLPGGGVSPGESLRASLRREIHEELQCRATCGDPVGRCSYEHTTFGDVTTVYTVFECSLESQPAANGDEDILKFEWVAPTELPDGLLDPFTALIREIKQDDYFE